MMLDLLLLLFLFAMGSIIGWVIELFFRRFCSPSGKKYKKWVNPGFLTGPYLPLYGFGLCTLYLLSGIEIPGLDGHPILKKLVLFVVMGLAMTLIEYITGLIFIKGMNIKLWDYSNNWGNIQGIICPLFSFFWAVLGAVYYNFINPYILDAISWLLKNLVFSFFIGFFYGIFVIDLCYSFNIMVRLRKFAQEKEIIVRLEALKDQFVLAREERKEKRRFMLAMYTSKPFRETMDDLFEKFTENMTEKYNDAKKAISEKSYMEYKKKKKK